MDHPDGLHIMIQGLFVHPQVVQTCFVLNKLFNLQSVDP